MAHDPCIKNRMLEPDPAPDYIPPQEPQWATSDVIAHLQEIVQDGESLRPTIRQCLMVSDTPDNSIVSPDTVPSLQVKYCHPDAVRYELVDNIQQKHKLKSTSRVMRQAMSKALPPTLEFRLHLDGGGQYVSDK
jgi:hypothetical protein